MLGTGMIGGGMVEHWLARGLDVAVWNRTAEKTAALVAKGAQAAATAAEAARGASRVHLALSDDAAVDAVLASVIDDPGFDPRTVVIVDHTTTSTDGTRARAERLAALGVAFVHAPVFMSPAMCREAKGLMLVAGPARERLRAALAQMTGEIVDLGERPEAAAAFKLFGNVMIVTMTAGLSDVFALAGANGIAAPDAIGLFSKLSVGGLFTGRGARMARGDYEPASFELSMARKDVRLMIESSHQAPLAALPSIAARMDALLERGLGALDLGALSIDAVPRR
jgi:3-hydroxyisobutyrate dehydrogenase-like beta-hydroxyacid dehydrogenase